MIDRGAVPVTPVEWNGARRIIRSLYPPIDLFEDIADPEDWPLLISAEQKTNPRLMETIGNLDLVPAARRIGGPGTSYLMAPFTHVSPDRPSRFTHGGYGVLYAAERFETALAETIHHHERFMARTAESEGWTSQFREIVLNVNLRAHDLRGDPARFGEALMPDSYIESQALAADLRAAGSDGIAYPSCRQPDGECVALFYPDLGANPIQGRHLDYHWDGARVDLYRDVGSGAVYRIEAEA
ncbi:RES domain-containing protein [Aureimonas flava]|uniref:RES domain-containing protein n=1 Tax=Aureimonas flava TaxID=2320271 RepID=A0A3A1WIP3_9HYPH|nr:RES domain-containing protein [Aureimonas flava]